MKHNYRIKQLILLGGDLFCFLTAFYLALFLRYLNLPNKETILSLLPIFFLLFIIWIFVNYINEMYKINKLKNGKFGLDILFSAFFSFLIGIVFFYLLPFSIAPKTILFLNVITAFSFLFFWRLFFKKTLIKSFNQKIIFVDDNNDSRELKKIIKENPELGFIIFENEITNRKLSEVVKEENIDIVIVKDETKTQTTTKETNENELYKIFLENKQIIDLANFYENITGRISPNVFCEAWFLENLQNMPTPFQNRFNRFVDILAATFLSGIFLLLFPIIALAIKLDSQGPIFFKQTRTGLQNKKFKMCKFRTMYVLSKDGSAETHGFEFAIKKDNRITKIGHFLRKSRIDELPQIINLFKGDLTLIGPRPERPEIIEELNKKMPFYNLRHIIKPGITGWAQVNQHYTDNIETSLEKLQYDLYYIKNRSLLLDITIVFKTINVILRGKGQ
ncbi:MAG: sugar transferase [Patescibacteria group bacterium]